MKIAKLEPSPRVEGRWLVWLEDGSLLRVGEGDVVSLGLYTGLELSDEAGEVLCRAEESYKMRQRALSLLSSRPMSQRELMEKLSAPRGREHPGEEERRRLAQMAGTVAEDMARIGLINDEEYACTVARHYGAKGYGERKIRDELYRRGVPREYWQAALDEVEPEEAQVDRLAAKKLRGLPPTRENLKKVSDFLARRGFGWEEISRALDRLEREYED